MSESLTRQLKITKQAVRGKGVVVAQNCRAAEVGAEILRQEGKLGIVEPGAFADLIVVDGDPLKKLELFLDQGAHLPVIMKAGKFHKNALK